MKLLIYKVLKEKFNSFRVEQTILVYVNVGRMIENFKRGQVRVILTDCINKKEESDLLKLKNAKGKKEKPKKRKEKADRKKKKKGEQETAETAEDWTSDSDSDSSDEDAGLEFNSSCDESKPASTSKRIHKVGQRSKAIQKKLKK